MAHNHDVAGSSSLSIKLNGVIASHEHDVVYWSAVEIDV